MTPAEKDALDARARRAGLTTSEFVRRRISDDDLEAHRKEIEALLRAIEAAGPSILRQLDVAISAAGSMTAAIKNRGVTLALEDDFGDRRNRLRASVSRDVDFEF